MNKSNLQKFYAQYPSAWKGHERFAQWLVRTMQPKVIVDLGVDFGFSTFAFAEPGIGTVYGIDAFIGDKHTGQRDTYDEVINNLKLCGLTNVEIIKSTFDQAAETWDKQIDILHIDGLHTYEAAKNDFDTWSKFVRHGGVILLHDTEVVFKDFGIKKFFAELPLHKINFKHSNGLGVIATQEMIEKIKSAFK